MPAGDGTGPFGLGPMTGRAAGYCAGYSVPGYMNPIPGRGWWGRGAGRGLPPWGGGRGRVRGGGRGWRWRVYAPYYPPAPPYPLSVEEEKRWLNDRISFLEEELKRTRERLEELEKEEKENEEKEK